MMSQKESTFLIVLLMGHVQLSVPKGLSPSYPMSGHAVYLGTKLLLATKGGCICHGGVVVLYLVSLVRGNLNA